MWFSCVTADGVAGHLAVVLRLGGPGPWHSVQVGGGRLQRRVAVVRGVHVGPAHGREVLRRRGEGAQEGRRGDFKYGLRRAV